MEVFVVSGRRRTFQLYTMAGVPLYAGLPLLIERCVANPEGPLAQVTPQTTLQLPSSLLQVYLGLFCLGTVGCVSILGGTLAVLPAYEADLYGPRYVGPIHGRMLLATTAATVLGPGLLLSLRHQAHTSALTQLLSTVDPAAFSAKVKWYSASQHSAQFMGSCLVRS